MLRKEREIAIELIFFNIISLYIFMLCSMISRARIALTRTQLALNSSSRNIEQYREHLYIMQGCFCRALFFLQFCVISLLLRFSLMYNMYIWIYRRNENIRAAFSQLYFFYHNAGFIAKMKNIENNYSLIKTVCNFSF